MGLLRNPTGSDRLSSSNSKDESRQDGVNMMRGQQDFEARREEFRKYLERAGVVDAFTKVLVSLYEETEKPDDALEYVCKYLGAITEEPAEVQTLKKELESAKVQIAELEAKLAKCELEEPST